jgi:hypothetical protein
MNNMDPVVPVLERCFFEFIRVETGKGGVSG